MFRRWLPGGSVLAVAAALLLLMPQTSHAQFRHGDWGRGGGWGFNAGNMGYYGIGNQYYYGYNPRYYSGYSAWNYPNYSSSWYPDYYGGSSSYWPSYSSGYNWATPSYYSSSYPSGSTGSSYSSDRNTGSYYGAPIGTMSGQPDRTVLIDIRIPPEAKIWFEGTPTQQTGTFRAYISPPLERGQDYVYHVRARWMENGQEVDKTRDLRVRAGDQLSMDFFNEVAPGASFRPGEPTRGAAPLGKQNPQRTPTYGTEQTAPGTDRIDEQRIKDRTIERPGTGTGTTAPPKTTPDGGSGNR